MLLPVPSSLPSLQIERLRLGQRVNELVEEAYLMKHLHTINSIHILESLSILHCYFASTQAQNDGFTHTWTEILSSFVYMVPKVDIHLFSGETPENYWTF